jgi:hypothetical protein
MTSETIEFEDPFADIDVTDMRAVNEVVNRMAAEELSKLPPRTKSRAEARKEHIKKQHAYIESRRAQGVDLSDMKSILKKQQDAYRAFLAERKKASD